MRPIIAQLSKFSTLVISILAFSSFRNSMQLLIPYSTVLLTGLSAGLFYAWAVSVIPGTRQVANSTYLETMQSINRAILNPGFYLIFFGSLLLLVVSTIQQYRIGLDTSFWLMLAACLAYLIGTFGVTVFGNVPLNESLDVIQLGELSLEQLASTRQQYEVSWNRLHMIRTAFAVLSFACSLLAVLGMSK